MVVNVDRLPWEKDDRKPVYARSGDEIAQLDFEDYEYWQKKQSTAEVRRSIDLYVRDLPPGKYFIRSITSFMYSCVGMVFACRRAWIEIDELQEILDNDCYSPILFSQIKCGDIVIYSKNNRRTHVGLVTSVDRSVMVLSKWGRSAEVEHEISVVPRDYGTHSEYWSERVPYGIA